LTDEWVFSREFEPRLKPNEYVLINNQYYQVVETRPMLPFYLVLTNVTAQQTLDLRDYGLKADTNQLLNYRLKIRRASPAAHRGPGAGRLQLRGLGNPVQVRRRDDARAHA